MTEVAPGVKCWLYRVEPECYNWTVCTVTNRVTDFGNDYILRFPDGSSRRLTLDPWREHWKIEVYDGVQGIVDRSCLIPIDEDGDEVEEDIEVKGFLPFFVA